MSSYGRQPLEVASVLKQKAKDAFRSSLSAEKNAFQFFFEKNAFQFFLIGSKQAPYAFILYHLFQVDIFI